ncbi:IPT/TIG domain-containing protein [Paenibacillus glucanolyticus]|uniref:IPT/TIG domain-containing protein n=1 Tax=Paenibacillus glucanolyticus TaxID=59843 RepID=UPI00128E6D5D|nr:IPT/TIG domain-containing protein [Paenibacillus glucanolyticus]MPY18868.1 cell shape-determining protein [Paenibacillus glucanolyticus]
MRGLTKLRGLDKVLLSFLSALVVLSVITNIPQVSAATVATTVTSVSPNNGYLAGGATVYVYGSNFVSGSKVYFGPNEATSVIYTNSTTLRVIVPASGSEGAVDVTVSKPDGTQGTLTNGFTYVVPVPVPPVVTSVSPNNGYLAGGAIVYVYGSSFVSGSKVYFGPNEATSVTYVSSTRLKATVPASGSEGAVNVTVSKPDGTQGTLTNGFTYVVPVPVPPVVTSVSPNNGYLAGGAIVYVNGSSFVSGSKIYFGPNEATSVTYVSSTRLKATVPASGSEGAVNVTVSKPDGTQGTLTNGFTYVVPVPVPPVVTSVSPNNGYLAGGATVYVNGSNFVSGSKVYFGPNEATSVTYTNSTTLRAIVPASGSAGAVDVTVSKPDGTQGTLTDGFTYVTPPPPPSPIVTSVSPNNGYLAGGATVYVYGSNFVSGSKVYFGPNEATSVTYTNSTTLRAIVPASGSAGAVDVTVSKPDGTKGLLASGYTYKLLPTPVIDQVTPNSGYLTGGEKITIQGSNFFTGLKVYFGTTEATVSSITSTELKVVSPASSTVGLVDLTIVNNDGTQGSLSNGYTYLALPSPVISQITPNSGLMAGGEHVFISGSNFQYGVKVYFGAKEASLVSYYADGYLEVVAPATSTAGAVDVQLVNPDNQSVTLPAAYTYNISPDPNERIDTLNDVGEVVITGITYPSMTAARVDYGAGEMWRVSSGAATTIQGIVYDNDGNPLANEKLSFLFLGHIGPLTVKQVEFVTDANGHFSFQMIIPSAVGEYSYDLPLATHYFDIVDILFFEGTYSSSNISTSRQIDNTSDSSMYHFAYSYYHG